MASVDRVVDEATRIRPGYKTDGARQTLVGFLGLPVEKVFQTTYSATTRGRSEGVEGTFQLRAWKRLALLVQELR